MRFSRTENLFYSSTSRNVAQRVFLLLPWRCQARPLGKLSLRVTGAASRRFLPVWSRSSLWREQGSARALVLSKELSVSGLSAFLTFLCSSLKPARRTSSELREKGFSKNSLSPKEQPGSSQGLASLHLVDICSFNQIQPQNPWKSRTLQTSWVSVHVHVHVLQARGRPARR